ncbi:alpha/beta fold hydrolase [Maribacter chungangensis]|uniref:Alpha/beta fold hydrolase n=1 Tax=Maribacter chungangensis TaxID=1069117 RepID=A0ABW3B082_9FLAO
MKKQLTKTIPKLYGLYLNVYALFLPQQAAKKAFLIFSKVRKGRVLPHQKDYLDAAKDKQLKVAGNTIQTYRWQGSKETVVLAHGWESNAWRWHKLIDKLQALDFNVIAFDAPAHGYSTGTHMNVPEYAQTLQAVLTTYGPKHVVGHSVGGMTALYNEYLNPSPTLQKMVTVGSPSEYHEIITHFKELLSFNNRVSRALRSYILNRFGFTEKDFSSPRFVRTNTKKGLLFHDRLDTITPYHSSEQVHAAWQGSTFITTEGLGHSMHQDEVNDQIVAFLAS